MLHQIGVGALGPVFRTYEPERDRLVAVKAFRLDITPEQAQALADELSRVADAGLFHPSIVEPLGAGVEGTLAYMADEYVAAESLDVALRHYAPASAETALPYITHLAGAIDFARAAGVGHGALHPRDVFVTPEEARATGFGVVEALERLGLRAPVRRPYSAPERIAGLAWSTPADVFSLAAIAYELLTGRRPAGLGAEIGSLTAGTPNGSAQALHAALARAMDEDPSVRYQTALQLASALEVAARSGHATATDAVPGAAPTVAGMDREAGWPPDSAATGQPQELELPAPDPAWSGPQYDDVREPEGLTAETVPDSDTELRLRDSDPDDIAAEREDDEAHQQLILQEASEARIEPREQPGPGSFDDLEIGGDISAESESDRLLFETAGMAAGQAALDGYRERDETPEPGHAAPDDAAAYVSTPPVADRAATVAGGTPRETEEAETEETEDEEAEQEPREFLDEPAPVVSASDHWHDTRPAPPADRFFDRELLRDDSAHVAPQEQEDEAPRAIEATGAAAVWHDDRPAPPEPRARRQEYARARLHADGDRAPLGYGESSEHRRLVLPALLLVVGLLVGVIAGYAVWGRGAAPVEQQAMQPAGDPSPGAAGDVPTSAAEPPQTSAAAALPPEGAQPAADPTTAPASPVAGPPESAAPVAAAAGKPDAAAARGTLVVRSTPNGAGVTVNGRWRGRTPLRLADLPLARYEVRVVEPGYRVVSESLTLSPRTPERTMTVRLQREAAAAAPAPTPGARGGTPGRGSQPPAARGAQPPARGATPANAFTGSIYVDSRPRGATVAINGKPVGVTPLRIPEMRIGTHVVRLELPDHRIWSSTARVTAGEEARVTGSLEPIQ